MSKLVDILACGDCGEVMQGLGDDFVDLIVTSPPYADARKSTYGGIKPENYVEWFLPKSEQMLRTLKPTGTFILNIKERVVKGERSTYVLELIMAMREQGWLWTEEFIWHKKNAMPGKWPNRFRDSWERLLQFNKEKKFHMYQDEVMVPVGDWKTSRLANLGTNDKSRRVSGTGSGLGVDMSNWQDRDRAYPTNVLHLSNVAANRGHSAVFPSSIPAWFIKLFTQKGDVVLDPFVGSGTTIVEARRLGRHYIGIDKEADYLNLAGKSLSEFPGESYGFYS